ncbi:MAG: DUF1343 domain-containing protein [Firmicutes bacterium]|nr:DUF1343 domain-containing protein [Bacillota bacterium]MCM1401700.1 DUF1343 domain-containing protein [Bacteroides sp.]MCM1477508.1 DUF1343 domain-containing protein [Bacteroides sp.]
MKKIFIIALILIASACPGRAEVTVGAERTGLYLPQLQGKRVALLSNHTGLVNGYKEHTLDMLLRNGVNVTTIFSPEHGFRGTADAGAHVKSSVDTKTGIPIASLYNGKGSTMPAPEVMKGFDVIVCDLQDVGTRFYTYYITMLRLMNAAAKYGKEFVVFDRPNPIGMMVDGPVLDMSLKSGVGALPIPVAHGMTLGELARMIKGEKWLDSGRELELTVVPCEGYTHATRYELPVAPSPNLKSMKAIYLYPSTCFFEGTPLSLGRGTEMPFEIYGHPAMRGGNFTFTPKSMPGATNPPLKGKLCHGKDLRGMQEDEIIARGVDFSYIIDAYRNTRLPSSTPFFTNFFNLLTGNRNICKMIEQGASAADIRATWTDDVEAFKRRRAPYLLYPEN